jgi:hypothetical protein
MKFKKLIILLVVLAGLLSLSLLKKAMDAQNSPELKKEEVTESPFKGLSPAFISKIIVRAGDEAGVEIKKDSSGEWWIEIPVRARAQKPVIEKLIENLSSVKGELRADSKELLKDFSISDEEAVHVILSSDGDKEMAHAVVSRIRPNGSQNFIRAGGSNRVFITSEDILSSLSLYAKDDKPNAKSFTDMQVLKLDTNTVESVSWQVNGKTPLKLKKEAVEGKTVWDFDPKNPKEEVDANQVNNFLSIISNTYGMEIIDLKRSDLGFDGKAPFLSVVQNKGSQSSQLDLIAGNANAEKKTLMIKVLPDNIGYEIPDTSFENLKKDRAYFIKKAAAQAGA